MKRIFSPGCALILYKSQLADRMFSFLSDHHGVSGQLLTCCRHTPKVPEDTQVINMCPGCDRRYRENYENPNTISLCELLADCDSFPFPDYQGAKMTIIDACPTRTRDRIHDAVRSVAERMNISIVEPAKTRRKSTCCGDTFYGKLPIEEVKERMKIKADEMPEEDVLVYCVSCAKSMFIGGKLPRYLVDLLFAEETLPGTFDPEKWHGELDEFNDEHVEYEVVEG